MVLPQSLQGYATYSYVDGEYGDPSDVILARNWAKPLQRLGQTSVFRFPVGGHPQIPLHGRSIAETFASAKQTAGKEYGCFSGFSPTASPRCGSCPPTGWR